jgi:hypothetical protein
MSVKRALCWAVGIPIGAGAAALVVGHAVTHTKRADAVDYARQHLSVTIVSSTLPVNGVLLHVVTAGPETGPPVVLLHGHPDFQENHSFDAFFGTYPVAANPPGSLPSGHGVTRRPSTDSRRRFSCSTPTRRTRSGSTACSRTPATRTTSTPPSNERGTAA